ncbi:K+ channel tetramerization domain containing protein [Aspergillus nomiae NRRL 13137]|uniref:K+ channel tetramerization domain containing protein n=1 Tax=Aspergillus nomiae NRRL (strain ATCC 15546 / NRRL 13137 / CBS 260.88 / M93) TaxID=1509407 RepID=A0A0L1J9U2_ASPN3|nr:K+ channel tetramerization domain containing protein [Aspergillus nomiae NRRL 13137]KNG88482.1 K+ channel tetramerization domain containing protein [Aspergillus nomiae NRRL 13137]
MSDRSTSTPQPGPSPSQPRPKCTLPPEKVFSIQIGTELFRVSGASIASDAPSYFSQFFEEQLRQTPDGSKIRTLYIDRDPNTFKAIARHLQGYHIRPKDGTEFVQFFADAQFYTLPRLISQLFESEIFIQIGDKDFQIPRDIFSSPGDSPNFFSLASVPSLPPRLRSSPDSIVTAFYLLHLLRGYPLDIKNETHRAELLRDCRYFHLRGLEQKLIPHHISFNPIRQRSEIVVRLEDVRRSGVSVAHPASTPSSGWATYSRPYVDEETYDLILEIGDETTIVDLDTKHVEFLNSTKARFSSLLQIVTGKVNLPGLSEGQSTSPSVKVCVERDTDLTIDGQVRYLEAFAQGSEQADPSQPAAKRRRVEEPSKEGGRHIVRNGHWRLGFRPNATGDRLEFILAAVKLDAYTEQRSRNHTRAFLGS